MRVMIMVTNMMIMVSEMMRRELKPVFDQRELGEDGTALLPLDYSNSLVFNEPIIIGICICLCIVLYLNFATKQKRIEMGPCFISCCKIIM